MCKASQLNPSGFSSPYVLGVCCSVSAPQCLFPALFNEVNLNPSGEGSFFSSSALVGSQIRVSSTTHGRRLTFGDSLYYPIQWVWEQGWGHLRATLGFGVFWFIPPSCPSLSLDNLLYREDFPWSAHRVGVTLVQAGFTGLSLTSRRC